MVPQAYAKTYHTNAVMTASAGQLVLMLYDGCLKSMALARQAFALPEDNRGRIASINTHLLKAQAIVHELNHGLNFATGAEFAQTMSRLYDFHSRKLLEANIHKRVEPLIEAEGLIRELRDAWAEMLGGPGAASAANLRLSA